MEVDVVWSGKGGKPPKAKAKGINGATTTTRRVVRKRKAKERTFSNDYQKGKFGKPKRNPKGSKDHKGKGEGYHNDSMKGKGKGKSNVPYNNCKICGKPGHWSNECWMKKVNQVNNNPGSGAPSVPVPPSGPGGSSSSTTSTTATVKRVFNLR